MKQTGRELGEFWENSGSRWEITPSSSQKVPEIPCNLLAGETPANRACLWFLVGQYSIGRRGRLRSTRTSTLRRNYLNKYKRPTGAVFGRRAAARTGSGASPPFFEKKVLPLKLPFPKNFSKGRK